MKHIPDDESAPDEIDWLKRIATEPGEEQLAALRDRVMQAVNRGRKIAWWPAAAAAAAAVIATVLIARGFRQSVKEPAPTAIAAIAQMPVETSVPVGLDPLVYKVHRRTKAHAPAMTLLANHGGDPVIRLRTTDPNVVVLWVMNTTSEGNHNE